jgi:2-methylcitrate dehydratase PrpD
MAVHIVAFLRKGRRMASLALDLSTWASHYVVTSDDLELADRSLLDTLAVAVAGRDEPAVRQASVMSEAGRWAVAAHIIDFDDLHMESTTHISAVCVPAALACGGGAGAYLAGAGVMARLGVALNWSHYTAGWHATCTAGAPAAAVAAGVALGLDTEGLATAMALAVPAAGGVQGAFGTDAKSLQVGFAVEAGVRAARLAQAGATARPAVLDDWLRLVGGHPGRVDTSGPAVPGGLAIKLYPCCYAMQRPIETIVDLKAEGLDPQAIERVVVRTPRGTVIPLIHHRPRTGLEGKFSLEYAVATALLDAHQGFRSFTDASVARPEAVDLMQRVDVELTDGGDGLLDGEFEAEVHSGGRPRTLRRRFPLGSPARPPRKEELSRKVEDCLTGTGLSADDLTWATAAATLRTALPPAPASDNSTVLQQRTSAYA